MLPGFRSGTDGASPNGGWCSTSKVRIYGTTFGDGNESGQCGSGGCGTVFDVKPPTDKGGAWVERVLYRFRGSPDGGGPFDGVTFDFDARGNLY